MDEAGERESERDIERCIETEKSFMREREIKGERKRYIEGKREKGR